MKAVMPANVLAPLYLYSPPAVGLYNSVGYPVMFHCCALGSWSPSTLYTLAGIFDSIAFNCGINSEQKPHHSAYTMINAAGPDRSGRNPLGSVYIYTLVIKKNHLKNARWKSVHGYAINRQCTLECGASPRQEWAGIGVSARTDGGHVVCLQYRATEL